MLMNAYFMQVFAYITIILFITTVWTTFDFFLGQQKSVKNGHGLPKKKKKN